MALTLEHAAKRRNGIGGSDISTILHELITEAGDTAYGCPRSLFYDKTGVEPDYEFEITGPIIRGDLFEPLIADLYAETTGHTIRRMAHKANKDEAWKMVSIDRQIIDHPDGVGILECKSVGREVLHQILKKGLPLRFVLQVQWGFGVLGPQYEWGDDAVLCGDPMTFITKRVERDQQLINLMVQEAADFWKRVKNNDPPDRLSWSDARCKRCTFRTTCQGAEAMKAADLDDETFADILVDNSLGEAVTLRAEMTDIIKEATANKTEAENEIKTAMTGYKSDIIVAGGHKITWVQQDDGIMFNAKKLPDLKKEHPAIYKKYTKTRKGSRPMNLYPI
jgi:predicted phage-related endonuclease